jgi:hypothetical protein
MNPSDNHAAPGLAGWAAQGQATRAAVPGLVGWAAQGRASRAAAPSLVGWAAQGRATRAAAPGLAGWAASTAPNLRLSVLLPPTQAPADTYVPFTLTLAGPTSADYQLLAPYAAPGRYALSVPPEVALTLVLASPRYEARRQVLRLAAGGLLTLTIQLAFRADGAVARKVRRHYLPG